MWCVYPAITVIVFKDASKIIVLPSPKTSDILFNVAVQYPFNCSVSSFHIYYLSYEYAKGSEKNKKITALLFKLNLALSIFFI